MKNNKNKLLVAVIGPCGLWTVIDLLDSGLPVVVGVTKAVADAMVTR